MDVPENVRKDLIKLLPASVINDIVCFTLYEIHARDPRRVDIIVSTSKGEVLEFYDRRIISSILLDDARNVKEITIIRNEKCVPFYILLTESEIIILSTNDTLNIHRRITNVESYELIDNECSGQPCLKVTCKDDAVPVMFDKNLNVSQPLLASQNKYSTESVPLITQLQRKLTEAKYNVNKNEGVLNDYRKLKQAAAFALYETAKPEDSIFRLGSASISKALKIKTKSPILKVCNKKVVIIINVWNEDNIPIENIHILLHGTSKLSISYTTKIFMPIKSSPFWQESGFHSIQNNEEHFIVGVIDLKELKYNICSKIEFEVALSYKKQGKSYLLPLENVLVSALDTMGKDYDVILDNKDDPNNLLAVLASSEKTDLILRHIKDENGHKINICNEISKHLEFEVLGTMKNVMVHKKSPYHLLYGLTIILVQEYELKNSIGIEVYSRSPAQVLVFIHFINDSIPFRIMVTLPEHKITAKTEDLSHYNDITSETLPQIDFTNEASGILNQATLIKEYFDKCMIKMNESTDQGILSKIGQEIDLMSLGVPEYVKLKNQLLNEAMIGLQSSVIKNIVNVDNVDSQEMMDV
ncbi:uncharacterized protein LOC123699196 [Colias croceus]|uniref:uncharacterized protein LOC123699196 n=1 Tax=Colias crocea TaxID=72248 RepID=UPI001E2808DF|nr:uncharacterized protein LOC123699196 [Colias croceus]